MELIRFLFVAVGGVVVDISIAYAVVSILRTPIWLAVIVGFSIAACLNYILHEVWTFHRETSRLSSKRALYYLITSGVTLSSRLILVAGLSAWTSRDNALLILIGSSAGSFFVNYITSKFLIFSRGTKSKGHY